MYSLSAAKVGVCEPGATPGMAQYPSYWARTVSFSAIGRMLSKTLAFSLRTASALNEDGGSIATRARSWNRWFWNISRTTPAAVVITGAVTHIHSFGDGDLHIVHVAAVPDRLEDGVGEAEEQDILGGFLAQVVIDAKYLAFIKDRMDGPVELWAEARSVPNGFSMTMRRQPLALLGHARFTQVVHTAGVMLRRCSQVIQPVRRAVFEVFR